MLLFKLVPASKPALCRQREGTSHSGGGVAMTETSSLRDAADAAETALSVPCSAVAAPCARCHNLALHRRTAEGTPAALCQGRTGTGGGALHHRTRCTVPGGERLKKKKKSGGIIIHECSGFLLKSPIRAGRRRMWGGGWTYQHFQEVLGALPKTEKCQSCRSQNQ